jgi:hypothetical protein
MMLTAMSGALPIRVNALKSFAIIHLLTIIT